MWIHEASRYFHLLLPYSTKQVVIEGFFVPRHICPRKGAKEGGGWNDARPRRDLSAPPPASARKKNPIRIHEIYYIVSSNSFWSGFLSLQMANHCKRRVWYLSFKLIQTDISQIIHLPAVQKGGCSYGWSVLFKNGGLLNHILLCQSNNRVRFADTQLVASIIVYNVSRTFWCCKWSNGMPHRAVTRQSSPKEKMGGGLQPEVKVWNSRGVLKQWKIGIATEEQCICLLTFH